MKYVVFDIDGVLARPNPERMRLIGAGPDGGTDWEAFYSTDFSKDEQIEAGASLVNAIEELSEHGLCDTYENVFLTSRRRQVQDQTDDWLRRQVEFVRLGDLLMRPDGDNRKASEVKLDLLRSRGITPENTLFIVDDEAENVQAFALAGYTTLLFKEGSK